MSLDDILYLSCLAMEYYDFVSSSSDIKLIDLSLKHVKCKLYDNISAGYKERCMNILDEIFENPQNSESFCNNILINASCNDIMTQSLSDIISDMLMFCQDRVKKIS